MNRKVVSEIPLKNKAMIDMVESMQNNYGDVISYPQWYDVTARGMKNI